MSGIDTSALTLNPKEKEEMKEFIVERVKQMPDFNSVHGQIITGVKMQEQIVFASQFGMTGLKRSTSSCDRQTSGMSSVLTQKYWSPVGIEDTLIECLATLNSLFKAYTSKIQRYRDLFDIEGSDLKVFYMVLLDETIVQLIWRAAWFADTAVAEADTGTAGLIDSGNVKFFDYFDGLWKQIFAAVTATNVTRYTIAKNAETTISAQMALGVGDANAIFEAVYANADSRLRKDPNAKMFVTHALFENQRQYLESKSLAFTLERNMEGFNELKWNSYVIVDMETVWDDNNLGVFVDNTTNNAHYLPHRVVFTVPSNIPIATLSEDDWGEIESFYEQKERKNYLGYGLTLDSKMLEPYMITVGY